MKRIYSYTREREEGTSREVGENKVGKRKGSERETKEGRKEREDEGKKERKDGRKVGGIWGYHGR